MAEITAALVKQLRDASGAGMMDCKKALSETGGDIDAAIDWLRTKGLSKAAKKAGRVAADGLVAVASRRDGKTGVGAVIEVNAETDFVARNELFQAFVREAAQASLDAGNDIGAVAAATHSSGKPFQDALTELIATVGENMSLRRTQVMSADPGVVASYIHAATEPGLGRIGVLVALKSEGDATALEELGRKIAMHVAATQPLATRVEDLDPAIVERERSVFAEQARESGKPDAIIEKMVEGRIKKFYAESVLLEQTFVMDNETPVRGVIEKAQSDVGAPIELLGFARVALGEGIEKEEEDFAAEVAAASGQA